MGNSMASDFPLHRAVRDCNLEMVKHMMIEEGVSVDSRNDDECTPLHVAVEYSRYRVAELLINSKCDLNLKDRDGRTPLMIAALQDKKEFVDLLLQRGAQVNCPDYNKFTLLQRASGNGWLDVVQRIVESGEADVNAANIYGVTALMWAAEFGMEDVATFLIRSGADIHRRSAERCTALHMASERSHRKVVQVLLEEEGLDLNLQDKKGQTPLHTTCRRWVHLEIVKQLLIAGADVSIKNNFSETALSVSIIDRDLSGLGKIKLLVQHGAFFEDCDYARILNNPVLKDHVLKDVGLCTQSIVNKFHLQSLPALYSNLYFSKKLPRIKKFSLNVHRIHDVENFVKCDIQANTFCNIVGARPFVLSVLCVQSLLAYQSGMKA